MPDEDAGGILLQNHTLFFHRPLTIALAECFSPRLHHIFHIHEAFGVDANWKAFRQLIEEIQAGHVRVVVTRDTTMIARDWRQFFEFMKACDKAGVPVICINEDGDAGKQYECAKWFVKEYFGREEVL